MPYGNPLGKPRLLPILNRALGLVGIGILGWQLWEWYKAARPGQGGWYMGDDSFWQKAFCFGDTTQDKRTGSGWDSCAPVPEHYITFGPGTYLNIGSFHQWDVNTYILNPVDPTLWNLVSKLQMVRYDLGGGVWMDLYGRIVPAPKPSDFPYYVPGESPAPLPEPNMPTHPGEAPHTNPWINPGPGGFPLPPSIANPLPRPEPWSPESPNVGPRPQPSPNPGTQPGPVDNPFPPGSVPGAIAPVTMSPGQVVSNGPNTWSNPAPRGNRADRPPPRTKERKARMGPLASWIWHSVGTVTEGVDFIDNLYESLPYWIKRREYEKRGRQPNPLERLEIIYRHINEVDIEDALNGYVKQQLTDMLSAVGGRQAAEASRADNRPVGYEAGPALEGGPLVETAGGLGAPPPWWPEFLPW